MISQSKDSHFCAIEKRGIIVVIGWIQNSVIDVHNDSIDVIDRVYQLSEWLSSQMYSSDSKRIKNCISPYLGSKVYLFHSSLSIDGIFGQQKRSFFLLKTIYNAELS